MLIMRLPTCRARCRAVAAADALSSDAVSMAAAVAGFTLCTHSKHNVKQDEGREMPSNAAIFTEGPVNRCLGSIHFGKRLLASREFCQ